MLPLGMAWVIKKRKMPLRIVQTKHSVSVENRRRNPCPKRKKQKLKVQLREFLHPTRTMTSFSRPDVHSVFEHAGVAVRNEESHETTNSPFVTSVAKISGHGENSPLVDVANSLARRGSDSTVRSRITDVDYASLVEWIRTERMRKLPVEGSSYDTALAWAMLFVERMHSFDIAIQQFAGDGQGAFQLVYAHCANLLEVCKARRVLGQIHQAEKNKIKNTG